MSYTIHVFSPQERPLLKEDLKAEMERRGFAIAFCNYGYKGFASDKGPINTEFEIIAACELKSLESEQFKQVVQNGDVETLREMMRALQACNCLISAQLPYDISSDWGEEEIEELLEEDGPEFVEALQQARSRYTVQANIHSADGIEFASVVWRSIGDLVGGLIEDDQEGIIEFKPKKSHD